MTSARFLASGVDHCRAGEDAHLIPVDNLTSQYLLVSGREYPISLAPALLPIFRIYRLYGKA